MMSKDRRSWYVVLTKPRLESQAELQLVQQGYEVCLLRRAYWKRSGGVWLCKDIPLFPRYLFVRPASAEQSIAPIRSTLGVSSLVCFGHDPARLSDDVLETIRAVAASHARHPDEQVSPFLKGERVAVTSGPLAGLAAVVTRPAIERVAVLLSLLGREKEVLLDADMLVKVV